jgi:drug/metabolite transporter (DMT)-like permease
MFSDYGRVSTALLAWYFVIVWGVGFIATKTALQYTGPFMLLALRFSFGALLLLPVVLRGRVQWPDSPRQWFHVMVGGLLMHAINLGGSHSAQHYGLSAGITALILATQPLLTAVLSASVFSETVTRLQRAGIVLGLGGVALVVWHKTDIQAISGASLTAVTVSLLAITAGSLYQRNFTPRVDLRSASLVQLLISLLCVAPLGYWVEGGRIEWPWPFAAALAFLVVLATLLAFNALHVLMRRGQATRVTSLMYLTPIIAVVLEWLAFGVVPTAISLLGMAITCLGVALVFWRRRG